MNGLSNFQEMHYLSLTKSLIAILVFNYFTNIYQINAQSSYCLNFPTNPGPNNFPQLPNKYQARVEVNFGLNKSEDERQSSFQEITKVMTIVTIR